MARYFWVMLLTASTVVGCVASFNVIVDRFRIFHEVAPFEAVEPNTRYWKTKVLGKACHRYDGYIFGNSRAAVIDPATTGAALGLNMFNYATSDDRINGVGLETIFLLLAFLALARLKSIEALRYCAPGECKLLGLDRIPEVRTLRAKLKHLAEQGQAFEWSASLCTEWMAATPYTSMATSGSTTDLRRVYPSTTWRASGCVYGPLPTIGSTRWMANRSSW